MRQPIFALYLLYIVLCFYCGSAALAQTVPPPADSTRRVPDTTAFVADTLAADSIRLSTTPKGDISTTIKYSARDSIRLDAANKIVRLYGDAKIVYGTMNLDAGFIEINYATNIMTALPLVDSAGRETGIPVFKDDPELYTAKKIAYNFKTKKGRVSGVVTQQGEGYIHGETIKKNDQNELYISQAQYTTCNLAHPHFYFNARKLKVIPEKRIYSGPFNLVVGDVPTPLGFAFGLFPIPKKRASGIIIPTFGETASRGFFLRNGGYYWAVNDYIGTQILGEIYSLGGYGVQINNQYFKRYSYNGSLSLRSNVRPASSFQEIAPELRKRQQDFWIDWQHNPIVKRGGRFSASVNAGTPGFNQNNSWNTQNYLSATFNSSVTYQKQIENSPFNYTVALRQSLNTQTRVQQFTLPDVNLNMSSVQPFANLGKANAWYRNTRVSYSVSGRNEITNQFPAAGNGFVGPQADTVLDINGDNLSTILENSRNGIQHNIPITTSFKAFKFFTISPNFTYNEIWNFKRLNYRYIPETGFVEIEEQRGFNRIYSYSANTNVNTRLYGVYYIKGKKLEAIRHMVSPNMGFTYRPDFGAEKFGYYQNVPFGPNAVERPFSRYNNFIYGAPGRGEQANLSFSVSNNLEAKVRAKEDTSGTNPFNKVSIIDNFDISTAYNLAADSFRLSDLSTNLRTTLFKVWNINMNASFDPYRFNPATGGRVERFFFQDNFSALRLSEAGLNTSVQLNPMAREREKPVPVTTPGEEALVRNINNNPDLYVDFTVPWSLNATYTLRYFKFSRLARNSTQFEEIGQFSNTLSFDGDVKLTDKWKIGAYSGYDFDNDQITYTTINIYRDLHCWEMALTWIPFGDRQSYAVTINAKASILQDLKLQRNRYWYDR